MSYPSFSEMISMLQLTHINALKNKNDKLVNNDFWYVIDHLQNDKLYTWCMRMIKKKHIIQGTNFIKVCGVLNEWEQYKSWSQKQKRYIAMMLITNWDTVTLEYPHHVSAEYSY
jgi:hypothetical protein